MDLHLPPPSFQVLHPLTLLATLCLLNLFQLHSNEQPLFINSFIQKMCNPIDFIYCKLQNVSCQLTKLYAWCLVQNPCSPGIGKLLALVHGAMLGLQVYFLEYSLWVTKLNSLLIAGTISQQMAFIVVTKATGALLPFYSVCQASYKAHCKIWFILPQTTGDRLITILQFDKGRV